MKRSINILCVVIICLIVASFILPTYELGYYFGAGVKTGIEAGESNDSTMVIQDYTPLSVAFSADINTFTQTPDSITVKGSNTHLPLTLTQGDLYVPNGEISTWYYAVSLISGVLMIVTLILLLIKFIRFISNINKDKVFDDANVKLLRQLGILLLIVAILQIINGVASEIVIAGLPYEFEGYAYSAYWQLPWSNAIIGFVSLLMAQIWAKGIQMRKEQELTI